MGFDRSKIRGAKISTMKAAREEAEKKSYGDSEGRVGYLSIEDGVNIFRIYPPHNPEDPPYQPIRSSFLKCEVDVYKDGGKTGETEVKNKKIFIASIHGVDTIKADPIETYIKYVYAKAASDYSNKDERVRFLSPITGFRSNGKWNPGLRPSTNFIYYAEKNGELGKIEFSNSIVKRMEELNIAEQYDEPIETDIFSDPDAGYSLQIIYDRKADIGKRHNVTKVEFSPRGIPQSEVSEALIRFQEGQRIPDEKLEKWAELPSLAETYKNVYNMRDFNLALDGLRRFDIEKKYGIFENEEFIEELNAIRETVPPEPEQEDSSEEVFVKEKKVTPVGGDLKSKKAEEVKNMYEGKESSARWSKMKCLKFIEAYVEENYGSDTLIPELNIDKARVWAQLALNGEELPLQEETSDAEFDKQSLNEKIPEKNVTKKESKKAPDLTEKAPIASRARIDEIRERMKRNK